MPADPEASEDAVSTHTAEQSDASTEPGSSTEAPTRLDRYLDRTTVPLLVAAFAYLAIYSAEVLWLSRPAVVSTVLGALGFVLYAMFVLDFGIRIYLSDERLKYIVSNPIDILVIVLPAARALRVLRIFAALRVLFDRGQRVNMGKAWLGLIFAVALLVFVGALAVLDAERYAPDATITSFPDAVWWGFVTITTVGYGDEFPVTALGQISAVFLMLVGIGLLGSVTATVAGWVADRLRAEEEAAEDRILAELHELRGQVAALLAANGLTQDNATSAPVAGAAESDAPGVATGQPPADG